MQPTNNRLIALPWCSGPAEATQYGYLSEPIHTVKPMRKCGDYAEDQRYHAGIHIGRGVRPRYSVGRTREDLQDVWKIVRTFNVTQSAEGDKDGKWTSVVAMAVLLP